jgi:hypothetical protein
MLTKKIYGGGKQNAEYGKAFPLSASCHLHSAAFWRLPRRLRLFAMTPDPSGFDDPGGQASLPLVTLWDLTIRFTKNHTFKKQILKFDWEVLSIT